MPRFYLDFDDASDTEGLEFMTPLEACHEASKALPLMFADRALLSPGECSGARCVIRDGTGKALFRVTMAVFVEDVGDPPGETLTFKPV